MTILRAGIAWAGSTVQVFLGGGVDAMLGHLDAGADVDTYRLTTSTPKLEASIGPD
jgi:hypothetical protein